MTSTPKNKTGIGRYIKNLVETLDEVDKSNEYFLFIQDDDLNGFEIKSENFHIIPVISKILRKTYLRIIWEQLVLPIRLKRLNIDKILCPNFTAPYLSKTDKFCVFHDLTYFFLPEMHTPLKRELFKLYILMSARFAKSIITISENSKSDIVNHFPKLKNKVTVTPLGAAPNFYNHNLFNSDDKFIRRKYNLPNKYILYVGTIEPRKNILNLIKGYEKLPIDIKSLYKLVLVGKKGWLYDDLFSYFENSIDKDNIIFPGFVEEEDLPIVYKNAALFAYISHYEGFGIPLVESMACSTPMITSNTSSMKEIAKDVAILVNPNSPVEIANGITLILTNEQLKTKLVNGYEEKLKYYNWNNCAKITLDVLNNNFQGE